MLLINNSGFGAYGEFPAPGVDHTLKMIDVNVRAPVELTGRLWDELKARGGMVATVASLAGFQPTPLMTTYAATKSFMLDWSVALDAEAQRHGIRCVAICPGLDEFLQGRRLRQLDRPRRPDLGRMRR